MKAGEIFNDCHRCYRVLREWLKDSTGTVPSLNLENPSQGYQWRPEPGRACDYVLDFERIGRRALSRSEWKGRLKLFNVYFVRGADYRRAIRLVGVAESTFDYWYKEVKRSLGDGIFAHRPVSALAIFPGSHVAARENQTNSQPRAGSPPRIAPHRAQHRHSERSVPRLWFCAKRRDTRKGSQVDG